MHRCILRIPGQVQREPPVYFTDPFNRVTSFELTFIRSLLALLGVLAADLKVIWEDDRLLHQRQLVPEDTATMSLSRLNRSADSLMFNHVTSIISTRINRLIMVPIISVVLLKEPVVAREWLSMWVSS